MAIACGLLESSFVDCQVSKCLGDPTTDEDAVFFGKQQDSPVTCRVSSRVLDFCFACFLLSDVDVEC